MNMIKLNFTPSQIQFVIVKSSFQPLLAVSEYNSPHFRLIKTEQPLVDKKSEGSQVIHSEKLDLHEAPITFFRFNPFGNCVISFANGVPEIWDPQTFEPPSKF